MKIQPSEVAGMPPKCNVRISAPIFPFVVCFFILHKICSLSSEHPARLSDVDMCVLKFRKTLKVQQAGSPEAFLSSSKAGVERN
jgi:hypothetical protein